EDAVEAAWRIDDGALDHGTPHPYAPGPWGPTEAKNVLRRGDRWHDPAATPNVRAAAVPDARPAAVPAGGTARGAAPGGGSRRSRGAPGAR
ncbi:MAG TPA: hypothetical protein VIR16_11520, partial [Candidatus Limnocylindrales bacterium]